MATAEEETFHCAAYLLEGWWEVPEGTTPQVTGVTEEAEPFSEGGEWFKGRVIIVTPTDLAESQRDADGNLLLFYMGEYKSWQEVESRVTELICSSAIPAS